MLLPLYLQEVELGAVLIRRSCHMVVNLADLVRKVSVLFQDVKQERGFLKTGQKLLNFGLLAQLLVPSISQQCKSSTKDKNALADISVLTFWYSAVF